MPAGHHEGGHFPPPSLYSITREEDVNEERGLYNQSEAAKGYARLWSKG